MHKTLEQFQIKDTNEFNIFKTFNNIEKISIGILFPIYRYITM